MNYKEACKVLELTDEIITNEMIKQQYRKLALKYHPDKNKTADTSQFVNIKNAYEYLMKHNQYTDDFFTSYEGNEEPPVNENSDYKTLLFSFLKDILLNRENMENIKEKWIYMILLKITNIGNNHLLEFLNIVSVDILIKIYDIINTYREVLHIPEEIIAKIGEILEAKLEKDECIVLNPFIEDLMENNLYKLTEGSQKFIIPLWHHELIYDISGRDLYVRCCPLLPDNITIDEYNNVIVTLKYNIKDIWGSPSIDFPIGNKQYSIYMKDISLLKSQRIVLRDCGISKINTKNIYDITKKGDIIVILLLDI